jgi:hypothetical protein
MSTYQDLRHIREPCVCTSYLFNDNRTVVDSSMVLDYHLNKSHHDVILLRVI